MASFNEPRDQECSILVGGPCEDELCEKIPCLVNESPAKIKTESLFSLMELPAELRLKIYTALLVCPGGISIPSSDPPLEKASKYPSVAILQTCKLINEEATSILYAENDFLIHLPLERRKRLPGKPDHCFQLSSLRWNTLAYMKSMSFASGNSPALPDPHFVGSKPIFSCSGQDIISRFSDHDIRYSPQGPDEYMALSVSNWVSTKVMRAELSAFQKELEAMMRSVPIVVAPAAAGILPPGVTDGVGDVDATIANVVVGDDADASVGNTA
ncbi:hypothetical protein B0J14DRAFT_695418 [Halenospora varia]|nr:hypothetical protein B0J14DRAFT_695418 [Halenospora varia]